MKQSFKSLLVALGAFAFAIGVAYILVTIINKPDTSTPQKSTSPPKTNTSELNATVKKATDIPGIEITNNETTDWDKCDLKLNGSYKRTLSNGLGSKEPLNSPYPLFTKDDGTKFDVATTIPKNLSISCTISGKTRSNYFIFD